MSGKKNKKKARKVLSFFQLGGLAFSFFFFFSCTTPHSTQRPRRSRDKPTTMSMINLTKVEVIDNPTNFLNPIQFEIEFEAVADLAEGLFFPPHNQTKKKKTVADPSLSVLAVLMMVLFCLCESWIDLRWKVIYVGSADKEDHDQVLDDINLGPIKEGVSKFLFKVQTPFFLSFTILSLRLLPPLFSLLAFLGLPKF